MDINASPWTHQIAGAEHLKQFKGGALFMEMGTGKTLTSIMDMVRLKPPISLILCPKAVISVWPTEFERFAPGQFDVFPLTGGRVRDRAAALSTWLKTRRHSDRPGVIVTNYDSFWSKELFPLLQGTGLHYILADESHRVKSAGGKASMGLWQLAGGRFSTPINRPHTRILTGTPMPHSFMDVYAQYRFMWPWAFGTSKANFQGRYAIMGGFENRKIMGIRPEFEQEFMDTFGKYAFIVRKDDVLSLPEATHSVRYAEFTPSEARAYRQMKEELVAEVKGGTITAANAAVRLLRLSQMTSGVAKDINGNEVFVGNSKQSLLIDTLNDIDLHEKVIVFARFTSDMTQVREALEKCGWTVGELSGKRNDLQAFHDGVYNAMAVQIQSGGVGVDFTAARYCIYYSRDFNLGNYEQSLARVHRPRQTRNVHYVHLMVKGTVDEYIHRSQQKKQMDINELLDELKFDTKK